MIRKLFIGLLILSTLTAEGTVNLPKDLYLDFFELFMHLDSDSNEPSEIKDCQVSPEQQASLRVEKRVFYSFDYNQYPGKDFKFLVESSQPHVKGETVKLVLAPVSLENGFLKYAFQSTDSSPPALTA